jgi:hypothetical protein
MFSGVFSMLERIKKRAEGVEVDSSKITSAIARPKGDR